MARILGMGNALVDIMTPIPNDIILEELGLPKGSMQLVDLDTSTRILKATEHLERRITSGGSAANTINGLAMLGVETAFLGKIGMDAFGEAFQNDLLKCGITPRLFFSNTHSGRAVALISKDSERTFATHLGAAVELNADDLEPDQFQGFDYFHIEGYMVQNHDLLRKALVLAKESGLTISIDMASYNVVEENLDFLRQMVKDYVDILFANEEEARVLTGFGPRKALDELAAICDMAVVKIGEEGSLVRQGENVFEVGAIEVKPLDTTGAGDLYASGFLYGLTRNYPPDQCGLLGSILAGNVIEVIGAKMGKDKWDGVINAINSII
ncbi:MAG: adenosine kinase [Bacteroides sp.]|nr:adenosine kinase [Bacteroides sp.]